MCTILLEMTISSEHLNCHTIESNVTSHAIRCHYKYYKYLFHDHNINKPLHCK